MGGLFLLLSLCVIMAITSFVAGALPLTMSLSQSQLRLISSIGVGILIGTSMTVIIPEGIDTLISQASRPARAPPSTPAQSPAERRTVSNSPVIDLSALPALSHARSAPTERDTILSAIDNAVTRREDGQPEEHHDDDSSPAIDSAPPADHEELPTFAIGFSLICGFLLMFFIDRLPRHATQHLTGNTPREISLDDLGVDAAHSDEESMGFLASLAPNARHARSNALTVGLVIHAAADGIAMGASSSTENKKLGFIIFVAIMIHKAPTAFGLTSVLLKQGLSKYVARGHLVVFSLAAPCGALSTWLLIRLLGGGGMNGDQGHYYTGILLLFSAGTFLYVAMHAMQEESNVHESHSPDSYPGSPHQRKRAGPSMRDTLATAGGMLLPLLTQIGHSH